MAKANCFQSFPLAVAALLVFSVLSGQDSKGGGLVDVGNAPWHAVLGQSGHSLSLDVQHFVSFMEMVRCFRIEQPLGCAGTNRFHSWESSPALMTDGAVVIFPISEL